MKSNPSQFSLSILVAVSLSAFTAFGQTNTNQPPVVNMVQPTNSSVFVPPASILLQASAQDFDGSVASVEFFIHNDVSLGLGSNVNPDGTRGDQYFLTWNPPNTVDFFYDLTARATDNDGAIRISPAVRIFVGTNQPPPPSTPPTNQPPSVFIARPTSGAVFNAPTNISFRAFARDQDGFVTSVEFFANNQSLGFGSITNSANLSSNFFFLTWSNVPPGGYDLTAKATDDDGLMRLSLPVHIFVGTNQPPPPPTNQLPFVNILQPTSDAFFPAESDIVLRAFARDPDGVVTSVEFFANSQSLGLGSNVNPDGTVSTNYFLTWTNVPPGGYDLTAKATDDGGAMRLSPVVPIFVGVQPPVVNIFQPTNNAVFLRPLSITIGAYAADFDGSVTSVEFFANSQSLGFGNRIDQGPLLDTYLLTWGNPGVGTYDLTAKATDNDGVRRTSLPVHILVVTNEPPPSTNQPPVVNIVHPTNNATFLPSDIVTVRAAAQDFDGRVISVQFFVNNQFVGFGRNVNPNGTGGEYEVVWQAVVAGVYDFTAKATDDDGATRISPPVRIFAVSNQPPPQTAITFVRPTDGTAFALGTPILITVDTSSPDRKLTNVEIFANTTLLARWSGSLDASFFSFVWNDAPVGAHLLRGFAWDRVGVVATSAPVHITVSDTNAPPTNAVPVVNWVRPTNGASFPAGSTIPLTARATDADGTVNYVEFFATTTNEPSITVNLGRTSTFDIPTNSLFTLFWSNAPAGSFRLQAVAVDNFGARGFSDLVEIVVNGNGPTTNRPPIVNIVQPTNTAFFFPPATIPIRASAHDFDGTVVSVEFFANNQSLGLGRSTNSPGTVSSLFFLTWSNVPAGSYDLAAKATDDDGAMSFSPQVHILVGTNPPPSPTNHPPVVRLILPLDGSRFAAPATIGFAAEAQDFDPFNFVFRVEFFANGTNIGQGVRSNTGATWQSNQWYFSWSNVMAGEYDFTAKATDNFGAMAQSAPVHVSVSSTNALPSPTNQLAVVNISATDPTASEGLVMWCSNTVLGVNWWWATNGIWHTNWPCPSGTNTATFTVRRSGGTNDPLRVYYSIGGTASNGVDYQLLSGVVTIPAGRRAARIVVTPIDDTLSEGIETVVLRLRLPLDPADTPYVIGRPASAAAYITDNDRPPPPCGLLADGTVHLCWPFTNQCFRVELSTNLVHWEGICTNRVADGAAHHLDPDATNSPVRFIRFIPVACPSDDQ